MNQLSAPTHVPPHLVRDFNYFDQPDCDADPHAAWSLLFREPDIFYSPHYGGHWVVTSGALIKAMLEDNQTFSSASNAIPNNPRPYRLSPIEYDPPDHTRLKAMGVPSFAPTNLRKMEAEIRAYSHDLIDGLIGNGRCDFIADYALHLPIDIFMRFAGLPPDDREMLLGLMDDKMRNPDVGVQDRAVAALVEYSEQVLRRRLETPGSDLISALIAAGGPHKATRDELLGYVTLMWFAGLDTVSSSMGFMARFLAQSPQHRRQLVADPALIPAAIEEMLRRFGVSTPSRILTRDVEVAGVQLKTGDMVLLPVTLYGLDERVYADPLKVDFARKDAAFSLVFGTGAHRCIGSFLARLELRIFLETWLQRIPEFGIAPGERAAARAGVVNSMISLPLVWEP